MRTTFKTLRRRPGGLTLLEVLIAIFIFAMGIIGVLAALPTGVASATMVVFQDAAINLAQSKFAEFRRDRVDPVVDLVNGSTYLSTHQEPLNSTSIYRDFAHGTNQTYQYFEDIQRYEWKVDVLNVGTGTAANPTALTDYQGPVEAPATDINLRQVRITVHLKNTSKEFVFTQYMLAYD